jgi:hypothetical protein
LWYNFPALVHDGMLNMSVLKFAVRGFAGARRQFDKGKCGQWSLK